MADVVGKHTKDLAVMLQQLRLHRCQKRKRLDPTQPVWPKQESAPAVQISHRKDKASLGFCISTGIAHLQHRQHASTDGTHRLPNISFRHRSFTRPRRRMLEEVRLPGDHTTLVTPPKGAEKQVNEIAVSLLFRNFSPVAYRTAGIKKHSFTGHRAAALRAFFSCSTS